MQGKRDLAEGTAVWDVAGAVFAGLRTAPIRGGKSAGSSETGATSVSSGSVSTTGSPSCDAAGEARARTTSRTVATRMGMEHLGKGTAAGKGPDYPRPPGVSTRTSWLTKPARSC